jgi:MurNAc alpha-1-phosphate uridylyltransferase
MKAPTHAMIFAAGLGLRMRPLTDRQPKPLLKIAGRTILDRILDSCEAAGVATAVVNTHYLAEQVEAHLAKRKKPAVVISREDELLETGGGVVKALPKLGPDPFYVINGDVLWSDGARDTLLRLASNWDDPAMDALLLLHPAVYARGYVGPGDFFLDQLGRIRRRRPHEVAPFVFTGLQILHPRLFDGAPPGRFSLNVLYDRAAAAARLYGIVHDGNWFHIGTPEGLARVEAELGRPKSRKRP